MARDRTINKPATRLSLLFCALGVSLTAACTTQPTSSAASSQPVTLTIGFPNFTAQDPLRGIQQAARLISVEGLVSTGRDGQPLPRLADQWTNSADGLTWTISLRPNAIFHDGTPVTSRTVKQSLERSLASVDRDLSPGLADISAIETPNDLELVIRLRARSTFLLDDLTVAITKRTESGAVVGTGPFVTASSSAGEIAMIAFDRYHRGTPNINRVIWKPYATVRTAWAAMMRGEVDFLYEVGQDAREFIQGETSTTVFPFLRPYVYSVIFNSNAGVFRDSRVRHALNFAVNRKAIVEHAFKGRGRPAALAAWPEHHAFDESVLGSTYDPVRASALLNLANLTEFKNAPGRPSARLHFTCLFPANLPLWERIGLLVQRDLSQIGIDMRLEVAEMEDFNQRLSTGQFDAVLLEVVAGNTASRPFTFWHSQSRRNVWGYRSESVDRALDLLRRSANDAEYRTGFTQFEIASTDDPPAIFLAFGETARAVSKRFQVIALPNSDILYTIADWRPAEGRRTGN